MKKLVIASGNAGKIREFAQMLTPLGFEIVAQRELGIADAEEPHATFVENALAKARHAAALSGMPAFADDSGICVPALGGEPGVHSARYAEPNWGPNWGQINISASEGGNVDLTPFTDRRKLQDERNNQKLLARLAGAADRRAHYYCVIVLVRRADDPEPLIAEGRWHGEVIDERRGSNGFGYDPYFYVPALGRTAAELEPDLKNAVSHRGQALRELVARLRE